MQSSNRGFRYYKPFRHWRCFTITVPVGTIRCLWCCMSKPGAVAYPIHIEVRSFIIQHQRHMYSPPGSTEFGAINNKRKTFSYINKHRKRCPVRRLQQIPAWTLAEHYCMELGTSAVKMGRANAALEIPLCAFATYLTSWWSRIKHRTWFKELSRKDQAQIKTGSTTTQKNCSYETGLKKNSDVTDKKN